MQNNNIRNIRNIAIAIGFIAIANERVGPCMTKVVRWWTVPTGWRTQCYTIDCAHYTFLLLQKHLTSGTELILIGWKIVPNEEHVQCDHRFASQPIHYVGSELRYIVKLCRALSEDLCRKVVTNARVRSQEVVRQNGGHIEHVIH